MMYIHNLASLRGVCTSYITQLRFVMYDVILHTSASLRVCKNPYQLCTNVITLCITSERLRAAGDKIF